MKSQFSFFRSVLHLFFPHSCCGCGSVLLSEENLFCFYCQASMPLTGFEFFPDNPVEKTFWGRVDILSACAHVYFTTGSCVQQSLHQLKYKGRHDIGIYLGRQMGAALIQSNRFNFCQVIIPLPLYITREKKRGYNQAVMISEGLSQILQIPVIKDAVMRIRKTETQTRKSRIQRWKNMEFTFRVSNPGKLSGRHILLVDDVITTGATLEACARELLRVPGVKVSIACLAHSVSA